jgi:hypothetical protein
MKIILKKSVVMVHLLHSNYAGYCPEQPIFITYDISGADSTPILSDWLPTSKHQKIIKGHMQT